MRGIKLTQGCVAIVDDEDFQRVSSVKWYARKHRRTYYATRNVPGEVRRSQQMHRFILGEPHFGREIDHINGNGLDNRRSNLRFATDAQTAANKRRPKINAVSRFKGVDYRRDARKWRARIASGGKSTTLGVFDTEEEAARAYDDAARKRHAEFCCVNFPRPGERGAIS